MMAFKISWGLLSGCTCILGLFFININGIEVQQSDYGLNYVTSFSKQYNKTTGRVYISVGMDVPANGPTVTVYWQVNEGVVGVEEPSFGSSMTTSGTVTTYSLVADTSYVRQILFTTRIADRDSSLRIESFDWSKNHPSESSFPAQLRKCLSTTTQGTSTVADEHVINVNFKCDPPFSTNYYNYPRVYWNMKFGLYLFNDTMNSVYYQPLEEKSEDKRFLLLSRVPRSTEKKSFPRGNFPGDLIIPQRGLARDNSVTDGTLSIRHELGKITIGSTTWAKLVFSESFLRESVAFLKASLDSPLEIGLGMVFSFVEKVPISKNMPSGVYLLEDGGKTFPQPAVVTCQGFGTNPPTVYVSKEGKKITRSGTTSVQAIQTPMFSISYVTFIKKGNVNREVDGRYSCHSEDLQGDMNISNFSIFSRPVFLEDLTKMAEPISGKLELLLVVEGNGQMVVTCHVPVPDHMILINKEEKTELVSGKLKRTEVTLTYQYPPEAVRPFDYFCTVRDEYGYHNTRHTRY